ncbi:RsfA family transcriptional regulator [Alkalicoccobacillus porphyridii]|uniref:RsfA family transcriptional regulator n=1 Tax=Alkalicoccobacillus porphyridii TaxID=2597270 RepID=A0A553ZW22_9BACI|nr:RsfA family transcriptional regulator [Alkalicoccobacillus porphyridii]TSB45678.1 RsfA family transcriptional regulator [Alkalicoccobacillus porphyridii]
MKVRQDAWSHEDDVLLAETVLTHIKDGSTQLRAFDEVGDALNRTSAACGFRWNAVVRQKHLKAIADAKRERKERKRAAGFTYYSSDRTVWAPPSMLYAPVEQTEQSIEQPSLDHIIKSLQQFAQSLKKQNQTSHAMQDVLAENEQLKQQTYELKQDLQKMKQDNSIIEEDYQSLIQIMNRARRMAILEDEEALSSAAFKMDKNGNLEKVAK